MSDGFPGITKPCPFCGKRPKRGARASTDTASKMFYTVVCYCGGYVARAWCSGDTVEEVLERWNTRSEAPPDDEDDDTPPPELLDIIRARLDAAQEMSQSMAGDIFDREIELITVIIAAASIMLVAADQVAKGAPTPATAFAVAHDILKALSWLDVKGDEIERFQARAARKDVN